MQNHHQPPIINVENSSSQPDEKDDEEIKQSNCEQQQPVASFNRNSTLSKSQRKRVVPQMNIKNLVLNSDVFSPPVLEQVMTPPLSSDFSTPNMKMTNGNDSIEHQRNSPEQNSSQTLNDPLGVNNPINTGTIVSDNKNPNIDVNTNQTDANNSSDVLDTQIDNHHDDSDNLSDRRGSLPLSAIEFRSIDLDVIEPYKKVISLGGHLRPSSNGET
ncbi:BCL2/adenovirus E1B 19 kDa protein-interacting protein-like protein, partial [Euroglyphus maynei]